MQRIMEPASSKKLIPPILKLIYEEWDLAGRDENNYRRVVIAREEMPRMVYHQMERVFGALKLLGLITRYEYVTDGDAYGVQFDLPPDATRVL